MLSADLEDQVMAIRNRIRRRRWLDEARIYVAHYAPSAFLIAFVGAVGFLICYGIWRTR